MNQTNDVIIELIDQLIEIRKAVSALETRIYELEITGIKDKIARLDKEIKEIKENNDV